MSPFRYRDDDESSAGTVVGVVVGALAGFAVGMLVAHKVGGFGGLTARLRRRVGQAEHAIAGAEVADEELDDYEADELESEEYDEGLEERVLEAFRNDPVLSERAVDIGSIGEGIVELAGWVEAEGEAQHAVTIARGVPGVDTVVNRIVIGDEERRFEDASRRVAEGDPSLTEAQWETNIVGTGKRRQGSSKEPDRHADPRVDLEERWSSEEDALRNAAEDTDAIAAERRKSTKKQPKGDRTGGSPIAPTGVPKGDHVAQPREADAQVARGDAARDTGGERTDFGHTGRP